MNRQQRRKLAAVQRKASKRQQGRQARLRAGREEQRRRGVPLISIPESVAEALLRGPPGEDD